MVYRLVKVLRLIKRHLPRLFMNGVSYARYLGVEVGENCRIYTKTWGTEPFLVKVGNRVTMTSGVRIITHDGATCLIKNEQGHRYQKYREVNIGDDVFIGVNSIIMPGVKVGSRVIIAAGSVVTKDIPNESLVGGNPIKVIGNYDDYRNKVITSYVNNEEIAHIENYSERVKFACLLFEERKND